MKKLLSFFFLVSLLSISSCKKFLDEKPQGLLTKDNLLTKAGVDGQVTMAYHSLLNNLAGLRSTFLHPPSNWSFGDVRSDDAYKGGGGTGDITEYTLLEVCNITADNPVMLDKWRGDYGAINIVNTAISSIIKIDISL